MFHVKHFVIYKKGTQDNVSRETFKPKILCPYSVKHFTKIPVKHCWMVYLQGFYRIIVVKIMSFIDIYS